MPRVVILGGTGVIGRAVARRLVAAGWSVLLGGRDPAHLPPDLRLPGVEFVAGDRHEPAWIAAAVGSGCDLLVDCLCFTALDADPLAAVLTDVGSAVMISSKAVYVDRDGRHSNSDVAPDFGGPLTEAHPTVAPGARDPNSRLGYGENKVAAEQVLLESGYDVTVIRPSKVHGEGATRPREWVYVKRVLDRRRTLLLAGAGEGCDHPSAAVNIAALIETVARHPGARILNAADPDAPTGRQIAAAVAGCLGHDWDVTLLNDDAPAGLGSHPWDARPPRLLDTSAARALGYQPVGTYAETVSDEVDWLTRVAAPSPDGVSLPPGLDAAYFSSFFDYDREDRFLAELEAATRSDSR